MALKKMRASSPEPSLDPDSNPRPLSALYGEEDNITTLDAKQRQDGGLCPMELMSWLVLQGVHVDPCIEIRFSPGSGFGVFAKRARVACSCPGPLVQIPQHLALSLSVARASGLGRKLSALQASDPFILWSFIALGRVQSSHKWHPYLSCLPDVAPDPVGWPDEWRVLLHSTDVGETVTATRRALQQEYERVGGGLPPQDEDFALITWPLLLWARGMHQSRCFPNELSCSAGPLLLESEGVTAAVKPDALGCLVPLLDMFNHRLEARIAWQVQGGAISFLSRDSWEAGQQVWNNYGPKSNASELSPLLLMPCLYRGSVLVALPSLPYSIVHGRAVLVPGHSYSFMASRCQTTPSTRSRCHWGAKCSLTLPAARWWPTKNACFAMPRCQ
jgi:hypothetical protein